MTSKERHLNRYKRRRQKRLDKIIERDKQYGNLEEIFSFINLGQGYKKCRKASLWKASTQKYGSNLFTNLGKQRKKILKHKWHPYKFNEFDIIERGKPRHIFSLNIAEKSVQSTFCNNYLLPIITPHLIYNNGASLKGKGTQFSINHFEKSIRRHIKIYGFEGGILFFDFHRFFDEISHNKTKSILHKFIINKYLLYLLCLFIDCNNHRKDKGLGLGAQVNQILAILYPNYMDHMFTDKYSIKNYAHFMDDGYIISNNLELLNFLNSELYRLCKICKIIPNKNKCKIVKITDNFNYLKKRYKILNSGKLIRKLYKKNISIEKRKIRKMYKCVLDNIFTFEDVNIRFHTYICSLPIKYTTSIKIKMIKYFNSVFINYGKYYIPKDKHNKRIHNIKYALTKS